MIKNKKIFFIISVVFSFLFIKHGVSAGECFIVWETTATEYIEEGCDWCTVYSPTSGVAATSETERNQQAAYLLYWELFPNAAEPTWHEDHYSFYDVRSGAGGAAGGGNFVYLDGNWDSINFVEIFITGPASCTSSINGTWDVVCESPPSIDAGPYVAAGCWPLLSASQESPTYLQQNVSLLWTFSDDEASCSGDCTHSAEYSVKGSDSWTALEVASDATGGYAWVNLPVDQLTNATTYAFRFSVTDCAGQTTQSPTYYFRVATSDAPPVITGGPWLAAGSWPMLSSSATRAAVLTQNEYVLWTFSDDYASCSAACTHRARYKKVEDTTWTWLSEVNTDPTGEWYAYTELPVENLAAGTYQFFFDVRDCAGQLTKASKVYYFKVAAP